MNRKKILLGAVVIISGCLAIVIIVALFDTLFPDEPGPTTMLSEVEVEPTLAYTEPPAQTGISSPTESPLPTDMPLPSSTPEPTPTPTITLIPTGTITPTVTPIPTQAQTATLSPVKTGSIVIINIFYNGIGRQEPDEYVEIRNDDSQSIQLKDWSLRDEADHIFIFPDFVISPDQVCRIYTNEYHQESCGFNYAFTSSAIWNNSGDCAFLYDKQSTQIDQYCY